MQVDAHDIILDKGKGSPISDSKFMDWLNTHEIPYFYTHQEKNTFSQELKHAFTKRPDFILIIPDTTFNRIR